MIDPNYVIKTNLKSFQNSKVLHINNLKMEYQNFVDSEYMMKYMYGVSFPLVPIKIEELFLQKHIITHPVI